MAQIAASFHDVIDQARAYQTWTLHGWVPKPRQITVGERNLAYEFSTHFHPFVADLIKRLNEGGFSALQDSDTLYLPQPNPASSPLPLQAIPDSTRATLLSDVTATRPNSGPAVALTAGTPISLPAGTNLTVAAGTDAGHPDGSVAALAATITFALPGVLPVSFSSGIQNSPGTGAIIVLDSTPVTITLPAGKFAVLASDGSQVELPANTSVAIRSGQPQPFFYVDDFAARYSPADSVQRPYPVKNLDFTTSGAYAIYNWELFFHAPLLIAVHLSQNQKFQDAQNWFHYIFNPADNSLGPTPQRFWKVAPFQYTDTESIEQILVNLAKPQDPQLYADTNSSINAWRNDPFQPWAVAKFRPTAYMLKTVMAYLDNLIAWGDSLFQQYTIETINEATQLYVMAANILGTKPQTVPKKGSVNTLTYNALRQSSLDPFGNALVDMEVDIPFDITPPAGSGTDPNGGQILASIGKTLYFCIPRNDKLLGYWDTVADRLFKIHNSLNLQGVFQKLPLYDPPIDPALLVRATAAGLDVSSVVSGLNQPLPLVRFEFLVGKATEICQEVKSLGANLLAAIEKRDNESISLLRARHESAILGLTNTVKYAQWQEAQKATQALQSSLAIAVQRYGYFQKLLGRSDAQISGSLPQLDALDLGSLEGLNFAQSDPSSEPEMQLDPITPDISQDSTSVSDGEVKSLSNHEVEELNKLEIAHGSQVAASAIEVVRSVLAYIPDTSGHAQPMGVGVTVKFGGLNLSNNLSGLASAARAVAEWCSYEANTASKIGSYSRRELEWTFQSNSAKSEINQIFKQVRGAQIREAIAKKEYDNHQVQMANAQQIVDFLQGNDVGSSVPTKETTIGFYALMKRDVKTLYAKAFQLAFEVAKKAERCLQYELGDPSLSYIQYNYLDGNEGLLAGEKLSFDVKTMEMAYHDLNQREYELTKHVSLRQVDPQAILQLRATGSCTFTLPEELFDMDGPGHYFRRAKSIAVTIPCVAGPYASVNCTLVLQKSEVRVSADPGKTYARQSPDDSRFNDYYGAIQAIVTSSGQADGGLFDTNSGVRYLPFERAGVAGSQWQATLPSDVQQFDYATITDLILHVRYTAREGGERLKAAASQNLQTKINKAETVGSTCLYSVRHEFPSAWANFLSTSSLTLGFTQSLYPYWSQGMNVGVKAVELVAEMSVTKPTVTLTDKNGKQDTLAANPTMGGLLTGSLHNIPLPSAVADPALALKLDSNAMNDLWLAITWGKV